MGSSFLSVMYDEVKEEEETFKNYNSDEDPYDEEYKRAWRARRQLAEEEYMKSLSPEQRQKYDERESKWTKWEAKHPRCAPS